MSSSHAKISPRISEQTYELAADGSYVFDVPIDASKMEIISAIEKQYEVSVVSLNTAIQKGKKMPSARKRQRPIYGNRRDNKKAYVRLAKGDSIKIFEEAQ